MNRTMKAVIAGALLMPVLSYADGFSYNYVEANYVNSDLSADILGLDDDATGFNLRGSIGFSSNFHAYVDYSNLEYSPGNAKADVYEIGLGMNHPLNSNVDFVTRLGYLNYDPNVGGSQDGFAVQAGLRTRLAERFELDGLAHYQHFSNFGQTTMMVNGRYNFTNMIAGNLGVEFGDNTSTWTIGARFTF